MDYDHLITSRQLTRGDITAVLDRAAALAADAGSTAGCHRGRLLGLAFFDPSTPAYSPPLAAP